MVGQRGFSCDPFERVPVGGVPLSSEPKRTLRSVHPRKLVTERSFCDEFRAKTELCSLQTTQMTLTNSYRKESSSKHCQRCPRRKPNIFSFLRLIVRFCSNDSGTPS